MPIWREEIFAPVAPVMAASSDEEALELTNDTDYGLVDAVLTGSTDRGLAFTERVESGMVHVNDSTCLDEAHVPFGGMGASGAWRPLGRRGRSGGIHRAPLDRHPANGGRVPVLMRCAASVPIRADP